MEQTLQDGKLYRHLNSLIVAHLRDNNLNRVSTSVNNLYIVWFLRKCGNV